MYIINSKSARILFKTFNSNQIVDNSTPLSSTHGTCELLQICKPLHICMDVFHLRVDTIQVNRGKHIVNHTLNMNQSIARLEFFFFPTKTINTTMLLHCSVA